MDMLPILSALKRHKIAAALILLEIALSCAIICNALFIVSQRLDTLNLRSGVDEAHLVEIGSSSLGNQDGADARTLQDLAALRAIPGVDGVANSNQLPFQNGSWNTALALTPDQQRPTLNAAQYMVGANALKVMGLKLLAGRDFRSEEYQSYGELEAKGGSEAWSGLPVILSKAAADKLFPDGSAVGKTIYMANLSLNVIGVVDTLLRPGLMGNDRSNSVIFPVWENFDEGGRYLIHVANPADRADVLAKAEAVLLKNDPRRLIWRKTTYEDGRADYFAADRDMISLLLLVCGLLLLVTALGIVGLTSFWVSQRRRQIGVRRALGATRGNILRYFQTENFLIVTLGIVLGMALAFALNVVLMKFYELPRLPLAYLPAGAIALWLLGQLSVLGPAMRAAAVPPVVATRS